MHDAKWYGTIKFNLRPTYVRGAHHRHAALTFAFEKGTLDYITLVYEHGNRKLYLDWLTDWEGDPPLVWDELVKKGEALNRKYEADPSIDRDTANIQNLDLFRPFGKSGYHALFRDLYNGILEQLHAPVGHGELHGAPEDEFYESKGAVTEAFNPAETLEQAVAAAQAECDRLWRERYFRQAWERGWVPEILALPPCDHLLKVTRQAPVEKVAS